ncbi:addiction module antidote protein, HigA family [Parazoarcus communis]|uniref:Addiction module antidote protein, HigA family n=1 Tax=Parazoarcus communis TaxID=41977 RepID=A0A2U8GKA6_9RHOO|nr:HigA family addiction module antitoxin [Parazoarcus communis]AWI73921.1 addiction module antidote protein, HigA family [Parazoarcus communis]PKO55432.1 MAG: addiction module antidote protein, HigA family [Betaproteobacteria bacterium HGW-Betaproteobacteria-19]
MMTIVRAGSGPRIFLPVVRGPARAPTHPGRFLETRFMRPAGISQDALARALGVSRRRVNELTRGRRAFTPDTAVRLGVFFGTDPLLWMHLQAAWDTHIAWRSLCGAVDG